MKNCYVLCILCATIFGIHYIGSCKKVVDNPYIPPNPNLPQPKDVRITSSYTEEFENVYALFDSAGWTYRDYENATDAGATTARWGQGLFEVSKDNTWYGFAAYSQGPGLNYIHKHDYAYSYVSFESGRKSVSSWLLSPVFSVKNGDVISFYARGDSSAVYTEHLQVFMNKSASTDVGNTLSSVGSFNTLLLDINPSQAPGGFPTTWTKYEYTFTGLSGQVDTRIAFRHYLVSPGNVRGVGIDVFKFTVK